MEKEIWIKKAGTFYDYFILQKHNKNTRSNNCSIRLYGVKLELARQSFYFYMGKLYNEYLCVFRKQINIVLWDKYLFFRVTWLSSWCVYQFQTQSVLETCQFIKQETLAQFFFCEFCKFSRTYFFTDHLPVSP